MSTERRNPRSVDIDLFPTERILKIINAEDAQIASAVAATLPEITRAVELAVEAVKNGGRIIYVGAGTSARIAVLDAAECPATFGTPSGMVLAIVAGGTKAITQAIEGSEDDRGKGAADLKAKKVSKQDIVIGVAASGSTPYTHAALEYAKDVGANTVAIVSAPNSPISRTAAVTICPAVGPEIITGSTRMKAGTAHKMVLNMISTTVMIRLGMTYSNWMINVTMSNRKLRSRGMQILQEILGVQPDEAKRLAEESGGKLKVAVIMGALGCGREQAEKRLDENGGNLRRVIAHLGTGRE